MTTPESGQSQRVSLRTIWPNETYDFTPWLSKNLHLLGDEVGMKLSLLQSEAYGYGGFLDVLAEADGKGKVAIENQIEPSDSDHLARLLGYAADHDARVLIWVASGFYEYHQRILGWMKTAMGDNREIHAVEISLEPGGELRPVDDDASAVGFHPVFRAIELHNDWPAGPVRPPGESPTGEQYQRFFQPLIGRLRNAGFTDKAYVGVDKNQNFPSGFPYIAYNVGFWNSAGPSVDVYLWISRPDKDDNKLIFDSLLSRFQQEIETELGFDIGWYRRDNQRMCSIATIMGGHVSEPEERLEEIRGWSYERLVKFKEVIQPRLVEVMNDLQLA